MLLGLDQGTTGSTAVIISTQGKVLGSFTAAVPQHFPRPGWVEHDPQEIWTSVKRAVSGVFKQTRLSQKKILSIGITNQRETVSVFDGHRPLHRFIVWQDRRTSDTCEKLVRFSTKVRKLSGLPIDPYFSATKIRWILDHLRIRPSSNMRFRTIDSYLLSKMAGVDATEATNASRTSLMNLQKVSWDQELFEIFKIPQALAPEIVPSEGYDFKTRGLDFLPNGIPVKACLGDQQAALFGQIGWKPGSGKITYGTGSFILLNTGTVPVHSKQSLVSTVAIQWASQKTLYALEGSAFICGAWIQWLRDQLGIIDDAHDSECLALQCKHSGEVFVVPALSGMGAPFWKPRIRGAILGISRGSGRAEIARASLEALCFQNKALVEAMVKDVPKIKPYWRVDGGAVKNNLLLQIQADSLENKIIRPKNLEATATGAALLAGVSAKIIGLEDIEKSWRADRVFTPNKKNFKTMESNYALWLKTIERLS